MKLRLALMVTLMTACQAVESARARGPIPLTVKADENPDVIWIVRQVDAPSADIGEQSRVFYGLFACYRSPQPGSPTCYLAKTAASLDDLSWPGNVVTSQGVLHPRSR